MQLIPLIWLQISDTAFDSELDNPSTSFTNMEPIVLAPDILLGSAAQTREAISVKSESANVAVMPLT